ncbi:hypothetical protein [Undibacterium pigrum]|uniref:Uncharacterized protein n=1 Tax=Undibacterium pigrum TaxID=401470 RepID=A0A318IZU1_9BURK|nr:hypothetical protein [Undibacterium pigrum]PXX39970.1 hypothetical protein DFR42_10981 [Undibacterium pigrum]
MKSAQIDQILVLLRQGAHEFYYFCRKAFIAMMELPLPHLLVVCLAIAIALMILPLALSIFIAFMIFKLIVILLAINVKKNQKHARQLHEES